MITRTVRGLPDELIEGYYNTGDQVQDFASKTSQQKQDYLDDVNEENVDSLPDMFFFNFADKSGQIVLGHKDDPIRTVPHQKLRIVPTIGGGEISKWKITTEDGTQYIFSEREKTIETSFVIDGYEPTSSPTRSFFTSWYLSKIYSAVGDDSITFEYSDPSTKVSKNLRVYQENRTIIPDIGTAIGPTDSIRIESNYEVDTIYLDVIKTAIDTVDFTISGGRLSPWLLCSTKLVNRSLLSVPLAK